jgi:hypothetical protein
MTIRALECRKMLPDTTCKLIFVGEEDEVVSAFSVHAVNTHGQILDDELAARLADELQVALFVTDSRAYVGDRYQQPDETTLTFTEPGFMLRRFGATHGIISLSCQCLGSAAQTCKVNLVGPVANCNNGTCRYCGWATTIQGVADGEAQVLPEFE